MFQCATSTDASIGNSNAGKPPVLVGHKSTQRVADVAVSLAKAGCLKGRRDCPAAAENPGPAGARPEKSKFLLGVIISADSIEQDTSFAHAFPQQ